MVAPPENLEPYRRTPLFNTMSVPKGLLREHSTKPGVWGVITVLEGRLRYVIPSRDEQCILEPERPGIVEPAVVHRVEPLGEVSFFVEFFREA